MKVVDINSDIGEGIGNDHDMIKYISSANIACGYHAGDRATMEKMVDLAIRHKVAIGAHPGYPDKEHFGRVLMNITDVDTVDIVMNQIDALKQITDKKNVKLHHVKLHGALYIKTYKTYELTKMIFKKIKYEYPKLIVYVAFNSMAEYVCKELDMNYKREAFPNRVYRKDGSIVPRKYKNAIIKDKDLIVKRALEMIRDQRILTYEKKYMNIFFDTLCIYSNEIESVDIAKTLFYRLSEANISVLCDT